MPKPKEPETIEEAIDLATKWAKTPKPGGFYGDSEDGGKIAIRTTHIIHNDLFYKCISITNISIPIEKRRKGLYKKIINSIYDLKIYGAIWYDTVFNKHLIKLYRDSNFIEDSGSFYEIIGAPCPEENQRAKQIELEKLREALLKAIKKPL